MLLAGSRSRSVLRQSTKDRISLMRQQQGLPAGNAAPEQLVTQPVSMTMLTQPPPLVAQPVATAVGRPATAVAQPVPVAPVLTTHQPSATSEAACDVSAVSIESSEAAPFSTAETAHGAELHAGQGRLPQTALLELVSNPLYAKSIEVSRTTSTSPTRLEASTSETRVQPEALVTGLSLEDSAVQVSDQPILAKPSSRVVDVTETSTVELPADQDVAVSASDQVLQSSDQPILSPAADIRQGAAVKAANAEQTVLLEPEVLQTSDQPILGSNTSATKVAMAVAAGSTLQQALTPAITASDTAGGTEQQASGLQQAAGPSQEAAADLSAAAAVIADSGDVVAVSSEPILTTVEDKAPQAIATDETLPAEPSQMSAASSTAQAVSREAQGLQQQVVQPTEVLTEGTVRSTSVTEVSIQRRATMTDELVRSEAVPGVSSQLVHGPLASHAEIALLQQVQELPMGSIQQSEVSSRGTR